MSLLLSARRVRVEFGKLVAVGDISMDLASGRVVGLIGPNGAGKTTLLRVMAGLQAPTAGEVLIMGRNVLGEPEEVRHLIGFAPDSPAAYEELSVEEFLTFIGRAYGLEWETVAERIDHWLDQLWLTEKRKAKIAQLSRGMKQRVTVARTLLSNPAIVLLDEPSQGLDPAGRIEFRRVVASLRDQGKAVVVSSHILADLEEYCTDIAIIERGFLLRSGPVQALTGRSAGRQRYRLVLQREAAATADDLAAIQGIAHLSRLDGALLFEFDEGREAAARLLRQLVVEMQLPVAEFGAMPDTLEEAYLQAGVKQVD